MSFDGMEFDADADYSDLYQAQKQQSSLAPVTVPPRVTASSKQETSRNGNVDTSSAFRQQPSQVLDHQASMPSRHHDPFSMRDGKTLVWKDINMTLVRQKRVVLDSVATGLCLTTASVVISGLAASTL